MDLEGNVIGFEELTFSISRQLKSFEHSSLVFKSDNKTYYFDVTTVPIFDDSGNMVYALISANDISEHINNQMQMRRKNDMLQQVIQTKDEFLSLISHEFKTPLTVINAAIQAMELICGNEMSEKARGFIKKIRQNTYRQIRLVNNLLDLSRTNAGHLKLNMRDSDIVALTRAITESVGIYAGQKGLNLAFATDTEKKMIGIDEEKYERILLNLLSNAIKFSSKGSTVSVSIHVLDRRVNIEVSDEGIGIPSDKLEIIFQRFGQVDSSLSRQAEGTGIGLSLVKLFIEVMDGTISVKSHPGVGSTFTVSLPDRSATAKEKAEALIIDPADSRIIQATKIEFSDIYL